MKKILGAFGLIFLAASAGAQVQVQGTGIQLGGSPVTVTTNTNSGPATQTGAIINIPVYTGYTGLFTIGDCLKVASINPLIIQDVGSACGSGGSSFITSLTTTGTSGPATVVSGVLNIPQYTGSGSGCLPSGTANEVLTNNGSGGCSGDAGLLYDPSNDTLTIGGENYLFSKQVLSLPGYNFGSPGTGTSTGARATSTYEITLAKYGQGNASFLNGVGPGCWGNGDCNGLVFNGEFSGANIAGSDQGWTGIADQTVIAPTDVFVATISSKGTPSSFPGVTLFTTGSGGQFGVGRWLIDRTAGVTFTATGVTQQGSGTNIYAAVTETGQTFTPSIQGSLNTGVNGPTVPNNTNTPILATIPVAIGSSCSVGDQFTIGGINTESAKIVSISSFTGGVMTITAWLRSSHESGAFFMCKGPTGEQVEQNSHRTHGNRFLFTVLGAINSTTLAISREIPNGMDAGFINGSGTYTLYPAARIVDQKDPTTGAIDGNMTLAETTAAFTAGDTVEVPNGTTQIVTGRLLLNAAAYNPYITGQIEDIGCPLGSTECGGFSSGQFDRLFTNGNPNSAYTIGGGSWVLRKYQGIFGPIGSLFYFANVPVAPMFEFQNTAGGNFTLWQADDADFFEGLTNSAGTTTLAAHASNFQYAGPASTSTNFHIQGNLTVTGTCTGCGTGTGSITVNGGAAITSPNLQNSTGAGQIDVTNPLGSNIQFAVHNTATTVNGQTCTLGSTCTLPSTNAGVVNAATCNGGVAFVTGFAVYDNNAPQPGCYAAATSAAAYLAFGAAPALSQYAESSAALPPFWTHTNITLYFTAAVNTGNVTWEVQTACPAASGSTPGSPTWSTAATVTTTVAGTVGQQATATITSIAANSVNGCPASGATTPSQMLYRIFRSASDTAAGDAQLTAVNLLNL